MQQLDPYRSLLAAYQLSPQYIEDYGKVKKVFTDQGAFALKQAQLTSQQKQVFINTMKQLHDKGVRHIVPIYPTKKQQLFLHKAGYDYYLMPWIESVRREAAEVKEDLIQGVARMHTMTEMKEKVKQEYLKTFYDSSKYEYEKRKLDYEKFIDICEQKVYMSPFELLYSTSFVQLIHMEEFAFRQLEDWYDSAKEKKTDRIVICHGNASPSHILYDDSGYSYLTNLERTYRASPIYDILSFFRKMFYNVPQSLNNATQLYYQYNRINQLTEDEQFLLFHYLTSTKKIHKQILRYQSDSARSEQAQVVKLQRLIWQAQTSYTFVHQLLEAIEQAKNQNNENEAPT